MDKYCGKCGALLDGGKFCPNCGESVELEHSQDAAAGTCPSKKTESRKKSALCIAAVLAVIFIITRFTSTVDEPCDWCGDSPSVAYKVSDGSYSYVCKECSKECAWCGDKATKHYENLMGRMVFVCNDCYQEIAGD